MSANSSVYVHSAFGWWEIVGDHSSIRSIRHLEQVPELQSGTPPPVLLEAKRQLSEYFEGSRQTFDLPLDFGDATPFQQRVWQKLLEIPFGQTTSYGKIAADLGDKNAMRAVGLANRYNRIAIVVPCHRCIAKNGDLQGYFYGVNFKRKLLALENPMNFAEQGVLF